MTTAIADTEIPALGPADLERLGDPLRLVRGKLRALLRWLNEHPTTPVHEIVSELRGIYRVADEHLDDGHDVRSAGGRFVAPSRVPASDDVFEITLSDGGVITTADLGRLLALRLGPIANVTLMPPAYGGNAVQWMANLESGEAASGRLVVHAELGRERVVVWAEVIVDGAFRDAVVCPVARSRPRRRGRSRSSPRGAAPQEPEHAHA